MEKEDDKLLLHNLGVTSANPEDIERDILAKAENDGLDSSEVGCSTEEEPPVKPESYDPSCTCQAELLTKLRAVKFEIDAVASTIEQTNNDNSEDGDDNVKKEIKDNGRIVSQTSASDLLQRALATDRLRSLESTKADLEQKLSGLPKDSTSEGVDRAKLIQNLVKDEFRPKRKSKEVQKPNKNKEKRLKSVKLVDDDDFDAILDAASAGFVETERDELVRKGILTPFHKLKGFERCLQQPGTSYIADRRVEDDARVTRAAESFSKAAKSRPTIKILDSENLPKLSGPTFSFQRLKAPVKYRQPDKEEKDGKGSKKKKNRPLPEKKWRKLISCEERHWEEEEEEGEDCMPDDERDGMVTAHDEEENQDEVEEIDDSAPHVTVEGGLKIPENIFDKLFDYQKVGVQWLWELHCQRAGGIIGDEMGLGKTVQILVFLGALHFSGMYKPSIVICPVTLLRQWKREARRWYPRFRVQILHDSARDPSSRGSREKSDESDSESEARDSDYEGKILSKKAKKWESLINKVLRSKSGLLITTYEQLRILGEQLLDIEWGYAILDEGHRIRNPNAEVTLACKQLQTVHRIIMTGSPIQNKLNELWSLFDFVFPGKLGVLPVFEVEFTVPITVGGYANASPLQVSTAYRCAVVLRDLIMPYLLRRMKADVNAQLPKKTEHVLFCSLTAEQKSIYRAFLASSDVEQIFDGSRNSLYGIDVMRKICNHPDLLEREHSQHHPDYGNPERSGKMKVVAQVLKVWKEQGHHVLLFAQTQQMLDIIENFMVSEGHSYRRMDGLTPVKQRMALIDEFNNSDDVFIFILTTKVGGLGTNLTGADRVIIFDPDWNPSTDMQARERAWRIGQKRDVTVYRLITRGTIEEKVYHRQIYKHFLTNKILKNPKQRRFFKARDMKDLFTLNDDEESASTETSNIFGQVSEDVNIVGTQNIKQETLRHPEAVKPRASHALGGNGYSEDLGRKGNEKSVPADDVGDEETNILKSLFDAQGIHSAMNHDAIMNAHDEEKMRLEEQASQVAQRAVEALRQSRMLRSRDNVSVPTWTGKSGAAGAPSSVRKKFGSTLNTQLLKQSSESSSNGIAAGAAAGKTLSSAELLSRIRGNQESALGAGLEHPSGSASSSINGVSRTKINGTSRSSANGSRIQPEVLARRIHTFIQQRGGSIDSGSIVEHFKERISPEDLPLFKNLLKQIAKLEKGRNGSRWILKPENQQL